jgi:secondary thiamine-phosphate synthase enzyme
MKTFFKDIIIETKKNSELINITDIVKKAINESNIKNGFTIVFSHHTTTGILINENETGLEMDIMNYLKKITPEEDNYFHHHYFYKDGRMAVNAWAHFRSILTGLNAIILIRNGEAILGSRENIYLAEFDGPKERKITIMVMGE